METFTGLSVAENSRFLLKQPFSSAVMSFSSNAYAQWDLLRTAYMTDLWIRSHLCANHCFTGFLFCVRKLNSIVSPLKQL